MEFLEQPLLVLVSLVALLNVVMIIKVIIRRKNYAEKGNEKPSNLTTKVESSQRPKIESIKPEIRPIIVNGEVDSEILEHTSNMLERGEIHSLIIKDDPNQCEYCQIFKDLKTIVCPNCGRPLNIKSRLVLEQH